MKLGAVLERVAEKAFMNILGLLVFIVGLLGMVASFAGFTNDLEFLPSALKAFPAWGIITAVGAVLYFFTRRARD